MNSRSHRTLALALLGAGVVLNTAVIVAAATQGASIELLPFWLWLLAPYAAGAILLRVVTKPIVALGWSVLPLVLDCLVSYSVATAPPNTKSGLAYLFTPLWNLLILGPVGAVVGWLIGRKSGSNEAQAL